MPERGRDLIELAGTAGVGALILGFWQWIAARLKAKSEDRVAGAAEAAAQADIIEGAAAFHRALKETAEHLVSELREEVRRLRDECGEHRAEIEALKAENEHCRGENRQITQRLESLQSVLRRNGIDVPEAFSPGALTIIENGHATVLKPSRSEP